MPLMFIIALIGYDGVLDEGPPQDPKERLGGLAAVAFAVTPAFAGPWIVVQYFRKRSRLERAIHLGASVNLEEKELHDVFLKEAQEIRRQKLVAQQRHNPDPWPNCPFPEPLDVQSENDAKKVATGYHVLAVSDQRAGLCDAVPALWQRAAKRAVGVDRW